VLLTKRDPIQEQNDEAHRRVAARIRRDPGVIEEARAQLERWIASDGADVHPTRLEWRAALRLLAPEQLAELLESPTPRAKRMRVSSPFHGLER
jgi:hypothetical protein